MKKYLTLFAIIIISSALIVGAVSASTIMNTNISTHGNFSVIGTSTLMGNVGIGTNSNSEKLSIEGNGLVNGKFSVQNGSILNSDIVISTSTNMNLNLASSTSQTVRIGTSAININLINPQVGAVLRATVCNPGTTAGALNWTSSAPIHWAGGNILPNQTTTADVCDLWTFTVTSGTSTPFIWGAQIPW